MHTFTFHTRILVTISKNGFILHFLRNHPKKPPCDQNFDFVLLIQIADLQKSLKTRFEIAKMPLFEFKDLNKKFQAR